MATNMQEKRTFPCEPATIEEISESLWYAAEGKDEHIAVLRRSTYPIQLDQISWSELRFLGILGKEKNTCNTKLEKAGMDPGFYISCRGDALVLIHQDDAYIQRYVDLCGEKPESLGIYNTTLSSLNISSLVNLRELYVVESKAFSSLEGLEQLTQLTYLNLCDCRQTPDLAAVAVLPQLTKLLIQYCDTLINFPSLLGLTQLKSLTLRGFSEPKILAHLGKLTQLGALHIDYCNNLTTLQGLENLTQLTTLELSRCEKLTALPGLENLTQLTTLKISRCKNLTALPELKNLTQLTSLNLSGCENLTALPELTKPTQLTSLNLSGCEKLTALPELENLTQLTSLDLSKCRSLSVLSRLENLPQLTSLNLSLCNSLSVLSGLENMPQLTSLNLSWCEQLTALSGLENMPQLTSLNLSWCEQLTALPGLENLTQLTSLNLSWCKKLTALPGLENLTQLTSLNLSWCRSLTVLSGLENLPQLTSLNLSGCEKLTALPELENLTQLTSLDLSGCSSLTALPGLENMTQLTSLDLSWCEKLTVLPESIYKLPALRRLELRRMHLRDLPDWFPEIAEQFSLEESNSWTLSPAHFHHPGVKKAIVYLAGTTVENVDMAVFQQPYEMVVRWFEERKAGRTRPLNEIKVVFLGDGEAGKSHTIARLMNGGGAPVDYVDSATPGIVIKDRNYTVDDRTFRVHYWDFGGQEIMHSMHRIFLTGRTMYVVLLNARDDTQSDRAHYWLHNIRSFAKDAPVLLVLNKIDQNPKASVDERTLRSRYPGLKQIVKLSALKDSPDDFNTKFTDILLQEIQNTGYLDAQWPVSWTRVKHELENMEPHYILGSQYREICRKCEVNEAQLDLLHWFNDLGVSFCFCDKEDYTLKKHVILRPDWITNGLYIILFNACPGAQNGQIPHDAIYDLLDRASRDETIQCTLPWASYGNPGDVEYVLGIMRKFQLSLDSGNGKEFIPMLCQQDSTIDLHYYEKDTELLEFSMEFDYLPDNLLHRLMVDRYMELDQSSTWRKGARFELKDPGYSAVVVIDGNTLRFFISGTVPMHRPNTYLTMLKAHVDRIVDKLGLNPPTCQLIYKVDDKRDVFDYAMLKAMQEAGQTQAFSMAWRRMIPIADILNQSAPEDAQKSTDSTTGSTNVYNFYGPTVIGDYMEGDKIDGIQNNHATPQNLTAILDKLIAENIQSKKDFVDHLLSQLEASEDKTTREIAKDVKTDPQKKRNLLTFLRKIVGGTSNTVSFLADAPDAVKTLTAITTAVSTVAAQYGPEIAEFLSKF